MSFPHKVDIEWLSAHGSPADVHLGHVINHIIDALTSTSDGEPVVTDGETGDSTDSEDTDREPGTWQRRRR